jgi:hypothetical protein
LYPKLAEPGCEAEEGETQDVREQRHFVCVFGPSRKGSIGINMGLVWQFIITASSSFIEERCNHVPGSAVGC